MYVVGLIANRVTEMHGDFAVRNAIIDYGKSVIGQGELSLSLLKAIDDTVDSLLSMHRLADEFVAVGDTLLKKMGECPRGQPIDSYGELRDLFLNVENKLNEVVALLREKRGLALADPRLKGHRDDLVREFDRAVESVARLHDLFVELRWAVLEHDADLEKPVGAAFSSAEDFIKAINA
jgi:hypothetical protein